MKRKQAKEWWQLPSTPLYDWKGKVLPVYQRIGEPPRIIVALWTKESKRGRGYRQYSLWSSGRVETRRIRQWCREEFDSRPWRRRRRFKWTPKLPYQLDRYFTRKGYEKTFMTLKQEIERL